MTHNASSKYLYKLIAGIAVLTLFLFSLNATSNSQNAPQEGRVFGGPERKLYNSVPTKLPLKFDVKNVTSERWIHELEVVRISVIVGSDSGTIVGRHSG